MSKWVVTGGAGFIGSALVWKLNQEGIDDILVVDRIARPQKSRNLSKRRYADYLHADALLKSLAKNKLSVTEGIVHLGATTSTTETDAQLLTENNFEYTKTLAQWALAHKKRFVYASSAATYGDGSHGYTTDEATTLKLKPLNLYGYSKHLFDLWAMSQGVQKDITGVKFFNIYGPNEYHKGDMRSVVAKAFEQIKKDGNVRLFKSYRRGIADGDQERDFLYVKEAVDVVYAMMTGRTPQGLINLGSGKARSWNDLVRAIFAALGKPVRIEYIAMPETLKPKYQYHTQAEMGWRHQLPGAKPFPPLENGVRDYVQNYLNQTDPYL